jgi:hypothetical protein
MPTNTNTSPEAVKRWHEEIYGMQSGPALFEGQQEYVRYEDYAALSAERGALKARVDAAEAEVEKWKQAFAAQSRKLQSVLHIEGVRAALQETDT